MQVQVSLLAEGWCAPAVSQTIVSAGGTASLLGLQGLLASGLHPWALSMGCIYCFILSAGPFVSLTFLLTRVLPDLLPALPEPGLRFDWISHVCNSLFLSSRPHRVFGALVLAALSRQPLEAVVAVVACHPHLPVHLPHPHQ